MRKVRGVTFDFDSWLALIYGTPEVKLKRPESDPLIRRGGDKPPTVQLDFGERHDTLSVSFDLSHENPAFLRVLGRWDKVSLFQNVSKEMNSEGLLLPQRLS
jgi:hypothetical protein